MILVTGANGLLGSNICHALIERKLPVKALIRENSDLNLLKNIKSQLILIYGDILIPEQIEPHLEDVHTIIHCAAVVSFDSSDQELMDEVNILGTTNICNLAIKNEIQYFIHISSIAAIGRTIGEGIVTEMDEWEESKWNSNYAQSKHLAEIEVWRAMEEGLPAVILNPSVIIAPEDWNRSSGRLFKYIWDENKFYPNGSINYVDIRDVVKSLLLCLDKKIIKERFIVNAGKVKYKNLFEEIAMRLKKSPPSIQANGSLVYLGIVVEKIKSLFTGKEPLITKETARLSKSEILFSNEKIKNELKINFAPLAETLDWSCDSILSRYS